MSETTDNSGVGGGNSGNDQQSTTVTRAVTRAKAEARDAREMVESVRGHLVLAAVGIGFYVFERPEALNLLEFNVPTSFYSFIFFAAILLMAISRRPI
jgi:hypothetical protein